MIERMRGREGLRRDDVARALRRAAIGLISGETVLKCGVAQLLGRFQVAFEWRRGVEAAAKLMMRV